MTAGSPSERAADYLRRHHVMTLATTGECGPWASAVFYASTADGALVFLSAPGSRHGRNLAADPRVAATIHEDYSDWREIRGIQLEGRVAALSGEDERRAREAYGEKYPLVGLAARAPAAIVKALAKVRWYRLVPERMVLIDNSLGFGHKDEIVLAPATALRQ